MNKSLLGMVAHVFNPSTLEVEGWIFYEFEYSVVYKVHTRPTRLYGEILFQKNKINSKIDYFVFLYALWV